MNKNYDKVRFVKEMYPTGRPYSPWKNSKIATAALVHPAEGLYLILLLAVKLETSLINLVGTQILTVSMGEW
jgi:hypothetical protein